ncbi:DUF2299 domain-containing protein [Sulfolobus sp. S-194]|uniref:DUF2299 domain-containing protein n=1 Tax=Sulfolobus sp. S-194 TaxID=2512240 RepID=UPI001436DAF9|nr:DUF2299 domain-containing protein [Sulfolobus sp. S-194]QIW24748.1 DUF2299 domain-containing protein [Sulfolobus sp. S-194]
MATDTEIYNWFLELGMKVEKVTSGNAYFHITVSPPVENSVKVSIIRTNPNSTFYIITVIIDLDVDKLKKNPSLLKRIKLDLMRMNLEFFLIPPDAEIPKSIQIGKIVFSEGLTKNQILDTVTLVKNGAYLVLTTLEG